MKKLWFNTKKETILVQIIKAFKLNLKDKNTLVQPNNQNIFVSNWKIKTEKALVQFKKGKILVQFR